VTSFATFCVHLSYFSCFQTGFGAHSTS
jgi:hypothetical protein